MLTNPTMTCFPDREQRQQRVILGDNQFAPKQQFKHLKIETKRHKT